MSARTTRALVVLTGLAALALPTAAFARGGTAPGGGATGGGGAAGGGAPGVVPPGVVPPAAGPCGRIASFKPSGGYRPSSSGHIGAVWVQVTVQNCGTDADAFRVQIVETVPGHPELSFDWSPTVALGSSRSMSSGNIDNDSAALSTPYDVDVTVVRVSDGSVLARAHAQVTTPADKAPSAA